MSHLIVVGVVGMHLGIYRLPNSATSDVAFAFASYFSSQKLDIMYFDVC
jgi:hypothetical protein